MATIKNLLKEGSLIVNSSGIGTVTRKMVKDRAMELAAINGHSAQEVSRAEWDQAKRELTGGADTDPEDAILEGAPESERWDPVAGSTGVKLPVNPSEDEDDEGRSDNERLVEEGVAEAEHDQMRDAARQAAGRNPGPA